MATVVYVGCAESNEVRALGLDPRTGDLTPLQQVPIPGVTTPGRSTPDGRQPRSPLPLRRHARGAQARPIDTERFGPGLKRLNETVEYSPNRMTPLLRLGEPFEVAHAVLFLASDEASYIAGHALAVTGGR
jgi:NAD(P)-dependent dehydrogenase (short-subunit alcohol dehydrogenase family)